MFVLQILTLAAVARAISNDPATEIKTVQGLVGRVLGEVGSLLVHQIILIGIYSQVYFRDCRKDKPSS